MMDWENLRYLAALARFGSLSAAARAMNVEHATIARRVAALEAGLGLRLLDRRGRKLLLTAEGHRVAAIAARMEEEALAVERAALAARSELAGVVTVSLPPALAVARLVEPLVQLQGRHPGLVLHVVGEKRTASLERREADIAIRLSRPAEGDLSIVRIGTMTYHFYASRGYLAGTPPDQWMFVAYDESLAEAPQTRRLKKFAAGRMIRFLANTTELQLAAVRAGAGIGILPDFMMEQEGELVIVDDGEQPLRREIWLAVHVDLRTAPAVRAVADCLREAMLVRGSLRQYR
jgi:DNA-binding transcriptional LysR family regulator